MSGHDQDNLRYTGLRNPTTRVAEVWPPYADQSGFYPKYANNASTIAPSFGSVHAGAMNMAFCDGSVQSIEYGIDPAVYFKYGGRDDDGWAVPGP